MERSIPDKCGFLQFGYETLFGGKRFKTHFFSLKAATLSMFSAHRNKLVKFLQKYIAIKPAISHRG